jgi:hypothetical protein
LELRGSHETYYQQLKNGIIEQGALQAKAEQGVSREKWQRHTVKGNWTKITEAAIQCMLLYTMKNQVIIDYWRLFCNFDLRGKPV